MKRTITAILFILVFSAPRLRADHIIGSDISYRCIRDSVFEVIYNFYRDCNGCFVLGQSPKCGTSENCNSSQTAPTSLSVIGTGTSCSRTLTLSMTRTSIIDITKTCASEKSRCAQPCNGSYPYGIEKHTFKGTLDLRQAMRAGCCDFTISIMLYVRSVGITTGQSGNTFYTWCDINACRAPCNNSPVLTNDPVAIICCNQPYQFNNGAVDSTDRDSLSFHMAGSYRSQGTLANYKSPLTPADPVPVWKGASGRAATNPNAKPPIGMYCDSITGDLIFTPAGDCPWVGIIVMEIKEWRKDKNGRPQIIGITRRDMQFIATNCGPNNPPEVQGPYSYEVCEEEELCFNIATKDVQFTPHQKVADTVQLSWNRGIPGATFTITNPNAREKTGKFCWKPKTGQASDILYTFTAIARDNNCPTPGTTIRSFRIRVKPRSEATRKYTLLDCGRLVMASTPGSKMRGNPLYTWEIRDSLNSKLVYRRINKARDTFQFKAGGKYLVNHLINSSITNCITAYIDTVIIPPVLMADLGKDTFACYGTTWQFSPVITNGTPGYRYRWSTPRDHNPSDTDALFTMRITTDTAVAVLVTDSKGCFDDDTLKFLVKPLPWVSAGPDERICTYERTTFKADHTDTLTMKYLWTPGQDTAGQITVHKAGKYILRIQEPEWGCYGLDTVELFVNDTVIAIAGPDLSICNRDTVTLNATHKPAFQTPNYTWTDLKAPRVLGTNKQYKIVPPVDICHELFVRVTEAGHTCEHRDTMCIKVKPLPDLRVSVPMRCYDYGDLNLGLESGLFAKYGNDVVYKCRTTPSLVEQVGNSYFYRTSKINNNDLQGGRNKVDRIIAEYTDPKTGCFNKDSFNVTIQGNPIVQLNNRIYCQDKGCALLDSSIIRPKVKTGSVYNWNVVKAPSGIDRSSLINDLNFGTGLPANWEFCFGDVTEDHYSGEYTLAFFIQDAISGCFTRDTTIINIVPEPKAEITSLPTVCINDTAINLNQFVELNGKPGPTDGRWFAVSLNGDRFDSKLAGAVKNGNMFDPSQGDGAWEFRFQHTATGCYTADSGVLIVKQLPRVGMPADMRVCSTDPPINLAPTLISPPGGNGVWSGKRLSGTGNSIFTPGSDETATVEGPYNLVYSYTDPFGCKTKDSFEILVQSAPSIDITTPGPGNICDDKTLALDATLKWSPGVQWITRGDGSFSAQALSTVYTPGSTDKTSGSVWLRIGNQLPPNNVCPAVADSIQLFIHPYPQPDFSGDKLQDCEPMTVNFTRSEASSIPMSSLSFDWDFGNGQTSTDANPAAVKYANWGSFNVRLVVNNTAGNCSTAVNKPAYIEVWPVPVAGFRSDPTFYTTIALPKFQFFNQSTIADQSVLRYEWNFGTGNPNDTSRRRDPAFSYGKDTATYDVRLIAISDKGCRDTIVRQVKIGPDIIVFVPNAFTPDASGPTGNDRFTAYVQNFKTFRMTVYNRWGEKLYETTDASAGWDGKANGVLCQQEVYSYLIEVTSYEDKLYKFTGTLTLLR